MELHDYANFTVCPSCAGMAGYPAGREACPQVCRCDRREQERWPDYDFNEYADLCWCCQIELIPSGSKWSLFYCEECRQRVRAYNEAAGRLLFFVGRHSILNGVGLRGSDADWTEAVEAFARAMQGWSMGLQSFFEAMHRWRPMRLEAVCRAVGQAEPADGEPQGLPLIAYLEATGRGADDPRVGKRAAFNALCGFLGFPPAPAVI